MNKEYTLEQILNSLIGHTGIVCESDYDDVSYKNLETLDVIALYIMKKLYDNAEWYGYHSASANKIANKSIKIAENIKEWCDDIISKKGGSNE